MTAAVRVTADVITDNSGYKAKIPVLLFGDGAFKPLLEYVLSQHHRRSLSWMNRVVLGTHLLLEYLEANKDLFDSPSQLFLHFAQRLCSGTIGADGNDPSGLYWLPRSTSNTNQLLASLNLFTDWLEMNRLSESLNPLIEANSHEERLNYAAWHKKNCQQFLGHIKDARMPKIIKQVRKIKGQHDVIKVDDDAIAFSEKLFLPFLLEGVGGSKDYRVRLRDQLILLMLHGCGVRESDALHLWIEDVLIDPRKEDNVIIRLYHPELGKAPNGWKGKKNQANRAAYLREKFGLTPRNRLAGTARVGWKTRVVDNSDNYIQLYWFPSFLGEVFFKLWKQYLLAIMPIERHHPYAFLSFNSVSFSEPYTLNAFNQNYKVALDRIELSASKINGLTPHSHRHAYGRRLSKAGVDPIIRKKALHHASLESQSVYTQPGALEVTEACEKATDKLMSGSEPLSPSAHICSSWYELLKTGFDDIDPNHLFTGANPRFQR